MTCNMKELTKGQERAKKSWFGKGIALDNEYKEFVTKLPEPQQKKIALKGLAITPRVLAMSGDAKRNDIRSAIKHAANVHKTLAKGLNGIDEAAELKSKLENMPRRVNLFINVGNIYHRCFDMVHLLLIKGNRP